MYECRREKYDSATQQGAPAVSGTRGLAPEMALCGTCSDPISSKHASMECGRCLRHHHGKCVGVVPHEAEFFETSGALWLCARCQLRRASSERSLDSDDSRGGGDGGGGGGAADSLTRPLRDLRTEMRRLRGDQAREFRELRDEQQALGDLVSCVHEKLEDAFLLLTAQAKKLDEAAARVDSLQAECALIRKSIG